MCSTTSIPFSVFDDRVGNAWIELVTDCLTVLCPGQFCALLHDSIGINLRLHLQTGRASPARRGEIILVTYGEAVLLGFGSRNYSWQSCSSDTYAINHW